MDKDNASKFSLSNVYAKARNLFSQGAQAASTGYGKLMDLTGANALKEASESIKQRKQGMNLWERLTSPPTQQEQQLLSTGLTRSAKTVGTIMIPAYKGLAAGSAGVGFGISKLSGQSNEQALKDAVSSAQLAPVYGSLSTATNPIFSRVLPKGGGIIASRIAPATANAVQGVAIDAATGSKTTPLSIGADLLTGSVLGPKQFASANIKPEISLGKSASSTLSEVGQVPPIKPPKLNKSAADEVASLGSGIANKAPTFSKLDELYTQFVDRFHPMSKLAKSVGKDKEMARALTGYYGSGSTATYHLKEELSPILQKQSVDDLKEAAIAMRDVELSSRGIKGSPQQKAATQRLQALSEKLGPEKMRELGQSLDQLYAYQDKMVKQYLVDTGIMSEQAYAEMRKNNQFYVPMKRVMDKVDNILGVPVKRGAGSVGKQNVIYKIKGSDKEILDPVESIIENTYKLVSLGKRQQVAQTIRSLSNEFPDLIRKSGVGDQKSTISLFENGKKTFYTVPPEVADAARGLGEEQLVMLSKILKVPTDLFRTMTTGINPEFTLPNIARDTQTAAFNAGLNPLKWVAGLAHMVNGDELYKEFLRSGGLTSRVSTNRDVIKETAADLAQAPKPWVFTIKSPKDIVKGLELLGQYSEQPTRVALFEDAYKKALKQGMSQEEALGEAAYWAQEGTVNFARRGSKMSNINAIYAYLNARIQGVDRMLRTTKNNPAQAATRFGISFLAPALALYAWNSQNPAYYDERIISERDKTDNFIFMLPGEGANGIRYLKIPKSEIGKVVNPMEEFLDYAKGNQSDMAKAVLNTVLSFSPVDDWGGAIPTAIRPIVEQGINKNIYFNSDIVPEYKQDYPAGFQDTNYTAPAYRMIGQNLNISPARLEHISQSYLGGVGRVIEGATRPLIPDQYKTAENTRGSSINQTPIVRRFAGGEKMSEEEFIQKQNSKADSIRKKISTLQNRAIDGTLPQTQVDRQIEKLAGQLDSVEKSDFRVGNLAPADSFKKKVDLKLPEKITSEEAAAYYLRDIPTSAYSSQYQEAIRQKDIWGRLSDINSSELLNQDQKDMAVNAVISKVGISREDYNYYQVAKETNAIKSLYAAEQITQMITQQKPKEEIINWLVESRRTVNGNQLLSSGVIDDLVDQNIISYSDGQQLKKIEVSGTGKKKTVSTKKGRPKKISVKKVKPPAVKIVKSGSSSSNFKPIKVKKISTKLSIPKA